MSVNSNSQRNVRLVKTPGGLMMMPPAASGQTACPSGLPIPGFPFSQFNFLDAMGKAFWQEYRRCIAIALMVDRMHQRWVRPEITSQRCHQDGITWTHQAEIYLDRAPHILIGGSYQLTAARGIDEITSNVSFADGLQGRAGDCN
jgi:hypothetical protein